MKVFNDYTCGSSLDMIIKSHMWDLLLSTSKTLKGASVNTIVSMQMFQVSLIVPVQKCSRHDNEFAHKHIYYHISDLAKL